MIITQDIFEYFCPVVLSPDSTVFDAMTAAFPLRLSFISTVIGEDIMAELDSLSYSPLTAPLDDSEKLCSYVMRYVCHASFLDMLPQLDLVLTPTGFGVVSNGNVAPASSDRIDRLRDALLHARDEAFDLILHQIRGFDGWSGSEEARTWISSLFWKSRHLVLFGMAYPSRDDLDRMRPKITEGEMKLRNLISSEFFEEICSSERQADGGLLTQAAVLSRRYVVAVVQNSHLTDLHRRTLISFIESHTDDFPVYMNSSAYRANHHEPYENRKEDPCFFFG